MTDTSVWARSNLHAWCVEPFDGVARSPEQRVGMIADLGLPAYAALFFHSDTEVFRRELDAVVAHGLDLVAWWWTVWTPEGGADAAWRAGDAVASATFELFRERGLRPRIWVMQDASVDHPDRIPDTAAEQAARVEREAWRIASIAEFAASYGCEVDLYTHNGWFGIPENEVAVLERATELGARGLGISYNFSHVRDELHDDTADFARVWGLLAPYVTTVNLAGTHAEDGTTLLPGDGDSELEMMRIIDGSGWRGRVGVIAESGGDAATTLAACLRRVEELAARL